MLSLKYFLDIQAGEYVSLEFWREVWTVDISFESLQYTWGISGVRTEKEQGLAQGHFISRREER